MKSLIFLLATLLSSASSFSYGGRGLSSENLISHRSTLNRRDPTSNCPVSGRDRLITAPKKSVFRELTDEELQSVNNFFLITKHSTFNLTSYDTATVSDNYIWLIESLSPVKKEAVNFYDSDAAFPSIRARVVIYAGGKKTPQILEYKISLPITTQSVATQLFYKTRKRIPFNARYCDSIEYAAIQAVLDTELEPLDDIFKALFAGLGYADLTWSDSSPRSMTGSFRRTWIWLMIYSEGYFLLPVGTQIYLDHSGTDQSKWSIIKIVYQNQYFTSINAFKDAFDQNKLIIGEIPNIESLGWAALVPDKTPSTERPLNDKAGPSSQSVYEEKRFAVDPIEKYVDWMGWKLYLGFSRDTGLSIWDVSFKGDRIAYEIALQDALAQYSGADPVQASTCYLDRSWGIGSSNYELLRGFDCPKDSFSLPVTMFAKGSPFNRQDVICIFETELPNPIARHFDKGSADSYSTFGTVKGYSLTIRTMSAVWNYDYVFDYIFYLDGTMEVKVSASGYIQATWWNPDNSGVNYGTKVGDFAMGSVHDHVMNYKVDLDIAGIENTLQDITVTTEKVQYPFFDYPTKQKKLVRNLITNENKAKFTADPINPHILLITNQEKKNKFGNSRAYRVSYLEMKKNMIVKSQLNLNNADWAKYSMVVTQRHENEPSSSSTYNQNLPVSPNVKFDDFSNGESIDQEDLIVWVNTGLHHVPRAEEIPVTLTTTSHGSFYLSPFNYFDSDPSRDVLNAATVIPNDDLTANTVDLHGIQDLCAKELTEKFIGFDIPIPQK